MAKQTTSDKGADQERPRIAGALLPSIKNTENPTPRPYPSVSRESGISTTSCGCRHRLPVHLVRAGHRGRTLVRVMTAGGLRSWPALFSQPGAAHG